MNGGLTQSVGWPVKFREYGFYEICRKKKKRWNLQGKNLCEIYREKINMKFVKFAKKKIYMKFAEKTLTWNLQRKKTPWNLHRKKKETWNLCRQRCEIFADGDVKFVQTELWNLCRKTSEICKNNLWSHPKTAI